MNLDIASAVVIDMGSFLMAGDDAPRSVFPTTVSKPRECPSLLKSVYFGDEAEAKCGCLSRIDLFTVSYQLKLLFFNNVAHNFFLGGSNI